MKIGQGVWGRLPISFPGSLQINPPTVKTIAFSAAVRVTELFKHPVLSCETKEISLTFNFLEDAVLAKIKE